MRPFLQNKHIKGGGRFCALHVRGMCVLAFENTCFCISSICAPPLSVYKECAAKAYAASVRPDLRRMRALCVPSLLIRMRIACLNAGLLL